MFLVAIIPTVVSAFILERKTRAQLVDAGRGRREIAGSQPPRRCSGMNGERAMVLGAVLGLLDTLVIAAGIAAWKHGVYPSVFPAVIALGMMPALVIGIGVGYLAR